MKEKIELIEEFLRTRNWQASDSRIKGKPTNQDMLNCLRSDIDKLCRKIPVKWEFRNIAELDYLIFAYNFVARSEEENLDIFKYAHKKKMAELEFEEKMRLF
jgi:hypothetical protein